jgi:hypothetical protein
LRKAQIPVNPQIREIPVNPVKLGTDPICSACTLKELIQLSPGIPKEIFTSRLLINQAADTLHTTTACKTTNSGLGDSLDIVAKHLAMALGPSLSESLSSLSTSRHDIKSLNITNVKFDGIVALFHTFVLDGSRGMGVMTHSY